MNQITRLIAFFIASAAFAVPALAGDILTEYQSRYTKAAGASVKEDVIKELVATGKPEAIKALQWCVGVSKSAIDDAREKADKARAELAPFTAKIAKKEADYFAEQKKLGNPVPKTRPRFPEDEDALRINAQILNADKLVRAQEILLAELVTAHGALVAKLPPAAQQAVRDDWTKNRLGSKDWGVRAETYELLGKVPTDWAIDLLVLAVSPATNAEPDPRALVLAVDSLAGRDIAKAGPPLAARMDDARWLVRVAVLQALEMTPSKDGIDAIVKRMVKEDGRLRDDCARVLKALTGQALPANAEMWRNWWAQNREKWTGKPAAAPEGLPDPFAKQTPESEVDAKKTGFFGIQIESKRIVFVIDVSGSMTTVMGGKGPNAKETRAQAAKAELKRVLSALEDGSLFNIVFFSGNVRIWKPDMQKADAKTRKEAIDYVDAAEVVGGTNSYDALEAAFGLGDMGKGKKREADPTGDARLDTIVFLSDGKPSVGRVIDPDEIRAAVKGWNKARRITIHAVAFGVGTGEQGGMNGADPAFMKGLADDTGGQYSGP